MTKRGKDEQKIRTVISLIAADSTLPLACRAHPLSGNFSGFRDCHIEPDWLLIYRNEPGDDSQGILYLEATGTHADLLK